MPYVMDSNYSSVAGLAGWPSYQPQAGWSRRTYAGGLQGLGASPPAPTIIGRRQGPVAATGTAAQPPAPVIIGAKAPGFLATAVQRVKGFFTGAPAPTIIGPQGQILGVSTKPKPATGKPGVLKPATGTMTTQDAQGRKWTSTVAKGVVTAVGLAKASAKTTVVQAVPVGLPQGGPPSPVIVPAGNVPAPVMASNQIATQIATPSSCICASSGQVPMQSQAALPPRGIYGGRLPVATQFAGRPIGVSATTSVTAVPMSPTYQPPTGVWANVDRRPTGVTPMFKPRRLNPALMPWG